MKAITFIWLIAKATFLMGADLALMIGVFSLGERLLLGAGVERIASTMSGGVIAIAASVYLHFRQDMRNALALQTTKGSS